MNIILNRIYKDYSSPGGLGGINKLYKEAKKINENVTKKQVKLFLDGVRSYTLHKPTRRRFPRKNIIAPKPRVILSCDLGDFSHLQRYNKGVKYIMVCIDVFSRYLQVHTLKNKSSINSLHALKSILDTEHSKGYSRLFTDQGGEFYNKEVKKYLLSKHVKLYSNFSRETKASLAERVLKTVKGKIYRYLTEYNTLSYIDVLPGIVHAYNNSPHRGLGDGRTPAQVHAMTDSEDILAQFKRMYLKGRHLRTTTSQPLTVGDTVRLQKLSRTQFNFHKGYKVNNTEEIFKVRKIDISDKKVPVYYLEDLAGDHIEGIFYKEELIKAKLPETFQVDIIKSKIQNGKRKYYVQWRGYPSSFNSWIDASDISDISSS